MLTEINHRESSLYLLYRLPKIKQNPLPERGPFGEQTEHRG